MDLGLGQNEYRGVGPDLPGMLSGGQSADHSQAVEVSVELSSAAALCQTLTPGPSPIRERGEADPLELIAEGKMSLADIARASGVSILELAAHVCTAQNLEALARVKLLHATQQEMLLGRLRPRALARLSELTEEVGAANPNEVRACEVMRKACVDILRAGNGAAHAESRRSGFDGGGPRSNSPRRESITPASEAEVLEALERWGREEEEQEREECPRHHHSRQAGGQAGGQAPITEIEDSPSCPSQRASGSVEPPPEVESPCTGKMPMPPLVETIRRGCHGPVPPARNDCDCGSLSPCPHGQALKTPLVHATRDPLHQPRPPPQTAMCHMPCASGDHFVDDSEGMSYLE